MLFIQNIELSRIIELLSYTIPSVVTGIVAFYFFKLYTNSELKKMKIGLLKENQKKSLPIKLQAYERMTLFLERINPSKLIIRVTSVNDDKNAYALSLINTIEQEFEHNLSQQIYISEECWNIILTSKNAIIHILRNASENTSIKNAQQLRKNILEEMANSSSPSSVALSYLKNEVNEII